MAIYSLLSKLLLTFVTMEIRHSSTIPIHGTTYKATDLQTSTDLMEKSTTSYPEVNTPSVTITDALKTSTSSDKSDIPTSTHTLHKRSIRTDICNSGGVNLISSSETSQVYSSTQSSEWTQNTRTILKQVHLKLRPVLEQMLSISKSIKSGWLAAGIDTDTLNMYSDQYTDPKCTPQFQISHNNLMEKVLAVSSYLYSVNQYFLEPFFSEHNTNFLRRLMYDLRNVTSIDDVRRMELNVTSTFCLINTVTETVVVPDELPTDCNDPREEDYFRWHMISFKRNLSKLLRMLNNTVNAERQLASTLLPVLMGR